MSPSLSLNRQFMVEAHSRSIDECTDIDELKKLSKSLLSAWQYQVECSQHYGAIALGIKRA